jgi:hypothetical protein
MQIEEHEHSDAAQSRPTRRNLADGASEWEDEEDFFQPASAHHRRRPRDQAAARVKDPYGEPERGSECEPIKNLFERDGNSSKTNTTSNTRLRLTTQVGQIHIATGVLLNLGTNFQPYRPENAAEHQISSPPTNTGQTGPC